MDFVDPRATPMAPPEPYTLARAVEPGTTVALLANGFPDSVAFLAKVEEAMAAGIEGLNFRHFDKGNASIVVTDEMLDAIAADCDVVVAAYGH